MKFFALIMAIYVFALAGYPCCENDNCSGEKSKTEKSTSLDNKIPNDDCGNCSPFFSCGTCSGFTFHSEQINTSPVVFEADNKASVYKSNFYSEYFGSIWQPPKLG